jgi:hypothetical protein
MRRMLLGVKQDLGDDGKFNDREWCLDRGKEAVPPTSASVASHHLPVTNKPHQHGMSLGKTRSTQDGREDNAKDSPSEDNNNNNNNNNGNEVGERTRATEGLWEDGHTGHWD